MFIASSYMVYAPTVDKHASHGFRVADILGGNSAKEMAPRKAACVVVQARITTPDAVPSVASRDLKFGMDRILSDAISTKKDSPLTQSPPPACGIACPACVSRCCPLPSCRCHLVEPFAVYPYQPTPYSALAGQHLVSYSNSLYASPEMESTMASLGSSHHGHTTSGKRKRSWSRAVFSNLQRKGLEKRFQLQKYITKPDRRQLAATLGLTDAQVKVWFQNRRMKWRHSKEAREQFKADKKVEDVPSGDQSATRNKNDHENKSSEQISNHVSVAKSTAAL